METVLYKDLGLTEYGACWNAQQELFDALVAAKCGKGAAGQSVPATTRGTSSPGKSLYDGGPAAAGAALSGREMPETAAHPEATQAGIRPQATLLLCEHPHVYTLGKSGHEDNMLVGAAILKKIGASYYHIDRGGDVTYHGPGQLVGYPILDLERLGLGLKAYIRALEQTVIDTVADYGIRARRSEGAAGVWLPADGKGPLRKICAIGVRSSHFVTMHGFALNVNTRLDYFSHINPCGFSDRGVTSMERELGKTLDMDGVKRCYLSHFEKIMNIKIKTEKLCLQQKDGCSSPRAIPRK